MCAMNERETMMSAVAHTSSAFEQDLDMLTELTTRLGGMASDQLNACLGAMSDFQAKRVDLLIKQDSKLDDLESELNERVLTIISMRAPRADDLRRVLAAYTSASALERIGDYARNTAERIKAIMSSDADKLPWDQLIEMGTMVAKMIDDVIVAHRKGDVEAAQAIRNSDVHVDKLHTDFVSMMVERMEDRSIHAVNGMHLIFIAKNLERIGDFTTSLAEQVSFVVTGTTYDTERPKADRTSLMIDQG